MNAELKTFGELRCRVLDDLPPGTLPQKLIILCHGFGAPGDDLAQLGPELINSNDAVAASCRFVFPEAPIDLSDYGIPGGRAWWPINMAELARINETRSFDDLTSMEPPGMADATDLLMAAVRAAQEESGVSDSQTILGGFSQGAMVTTNLVLDRGFCPQLLVLFSGTLLNSQHWKAQAANHPTCDVLQSHGTIDMVLPFEPAELLREMLLNAGFDVTFRSFRGPHTIPMEMLVELQQRLSRPSDD
jgi:phospholipase/carboxylesterase